MYFFIAAVGLRNALAYKSINVALIIMMICYVLPVCRAIQVVLEHLDLQAHLVLAVYQAWKDQGANRLMEATVSRVPKYV